MSLTRRIQTGFNAVMTLLVSKYATIPLGVSAIAVFPDTKIRDTFIKAIKETGHIGPATKSVSASADRVHYGQALSKFIMNVPSYAMQNILGPHRLVIAVEVPDRAWSAHIAKKVFNDDGYKAEIHTHAESEFPDGLIVFVTVPATKGIALLFWPQNQDVPLTVALKLPKQERWSDTL